MKTSELTIMYIFAFNGGTQNNYLISAKNNSFVYDLHLDYIIKLGNKSISSWEINTFKIQRSYLQNLIEDPILSNVSYLVNTTLSKAPSQCLMFNCAMNMIIAFNGPLLPFECHDIPWQWTFNSIRKPYSMHNNPKMYCNFCAFVFIFF
jgi:hypothetical protein